MKTLIFPDIVSNQQRFGAGIKTTLPKTKPFLSKHKRACKSRDHEVVKTIRIYDTALCTGHLSRLFFSKLAWMCVWISASWHRQSACLFNKVRINAAINSESMPLCLCVCVFLFEDTLIISIIRNFFINLKIPRWCIFKSSRGSFINVLAATWKQILGLGIFTA